MKSERMNLKAIVYVVMVLIVTFCCSVMQSQGVEAKTKKVSMVKKANIRVGNKKKIKLKNNKKKVKWTIKNKKIAKIVKKSKKYVTIKGKKAGKTKLIAKVGKKKYVCKITVKKKTNNKANNNATNVVENEKYTYSVEPLLAPFDFMFYVKTNNPNPEKIRFVDKKSSYYNSKDDIGYIVPCDTKFYDVKYDNKETGRVKDGYIFVSEGDDLDGGELVMQVATDKYNENYVDTSIKVNCKSVKSSAQYLVDEYTNSTMTVFEKLDAIQKKLGEISIYPRSLLDSSVKSAGTPYPFFATSPYPELSLNAHYEMYEYSDDSLLTKWLYPFDIDSLGFPSLMYRVALIVDSSCTVEWGDYHYMIEVTYNGETRAYGGAGNGDNAPIYTSDVKDKYLFDGSANDQLKEITLDKLKDRLLKYGAIADERQSKLEGALEGAEFVQKIGTGSWLRVGCEPYWVGYAPSIAYTYVSGGFTETSTRRVEDAWVDGRYVNIYNKLELGAKFEDYPTADIILRNQSYTNIDGEQKIGDIHYSYDSSSDSWKAIFTYLGRYWYSSSEIENIPEQFILTKEEVATLDLDCNTDKLPENGLIYDSSAVPGTAFIN